MDEKRIKELRYMAKARYVDGWLPNECLDEIERLREELDSLRTAFADVPVGVQQQCMETFGHVPAVAAQWMAYYPVAWIPLAVDATKKAGKTSWQYTRAILEAWRIAGAPDIAKEEDKRDQVVL